RLTVNLDELDMWLAALQFGTESQEFSGGPFGAAFTKQYPGIVIRKSSENIRNVLAKVLEHSVALRSHVFELIKEHDRYVQYDVTLDGKTSTLPEFLNMAQIHHLEWVKQLKDAVNIETTFNQTTDLQKDLLGKWLTSYSVDNPKFMDLAQKMLKQQTQMFKMAASINSEEKFADKLRLLNRGIGVISKIEKYFTGMQKLTAATYQELESAKSEKFKVMTQSADQINTELANLTEGAGREMQEALSASDSVKKRGTAFLMFLTIAAVAIAVIMGILISRYLAKRIHDLAETTKKIAQGNLQKTLSVTSNDELGALAGDTNTMIGNLRKMIGQILTFSGNLSQSSTSLAEISNTLNEEAKNLNAKSKEAADATGVMSSSMLDMSTIANESMERVHSVAQATEEMTSTISEIAEKTEMARSVTARAVITVEQTTIKMTGLSEAARDISKVAEVIDNIADQTNLLSLNATIEAARAGDAGKGFAVVANEVKELAKQTNMATGDIRQKIEAIQHSSEMTIAEIKEISDIINDINSIVVVIAGAVEEQAVTTRQITEDISSVSGAIDDMTKTVGSAAETAKTVSHDIETVNTTSNNVRNDSLHIKGKAGELDQLAKELQTLVAKFDL
ncbi:MAG: methyl-accepting chemotaxis protein, partial [Desulfoprunum sp.]|nr:methyl-accepting chemotaxis protein [Desulfoprunum sp.]